MREVRNMYQCLLFQLCNKEFFAKCKIISWQLLITRFNWTTVETEFFIYAMNLLQLRYTPTAKSIGDDQLDNIKLSFKGFFLWLREML